jgi:bifunctional NMN adenylyltransferase/nudix hydrolase
MTKQFDALVFIGRFQPLHLGHCAVIDRALELTDNLIIVIGSADTSRSPKNPFTFEERSRMIFGSFFSSRDRIHILPASDHLYNDDAWVASVQKSVHKKVLEISNPSEHVTLHGINDFKIGLIGHEKDNTSFYLKLFPDWNSYSVDNVDGINASDIRKRWLSGIWIEEPIPENVARFMDTFPNHIFKNLHDWMLFDQKYNPKEYDVNIVTADAVVVQSGNILLVRRKGVNGRGLLALPGGHLNTNERVIDAAVRELKEETCIADHRGEIPPAMLKSFITKNDVFDHPNRSSRGRVITHAFLFNVPNRTKMFTVKGEDDAESAQWYPLGTLDPREFFEDHYDIIRKMVGV